MATLHTKAHPALAAKPPDFQHFKERPPELRDRVVEWLPLSCPPKRPSLGDREPRTIPPKDLPCQVVFFGGGRGGGGVRIVGTKKGKICTTPSFALRDVDRRFLWGGAWILRSDIFILSEPSWSWTGWRNALLINLATKTPLSSHQLKQVLSLRTRNLGEWSSLRTLFVMFHGLCAL